MDRNCNLSIHWALDSTEIWTTTHKLLAKKNAKKVVNVQKHARMYHMVKNPFTSYVCCVLFYFALVFCFGCVVKILFYYVVCLCFVCMLAYQGIFVNIFFFSGDRLCVSVSGTNSFFLCLFLFSFFLFSLKPSKFVLNSSCFFFRTPAAALKIHERTQTNSHIHFIKHKNIN